VYDVLIKNGQIVDGTGNPWFKADIAIASGKIVKIGRGLQGEAKTIIDASGRIVSPGFIDAHTHSDFNVLADPLCQSTIQQGVTTQVVGNCGSSPGPRAEGDEKNLGRLAAFPWLKPEWTTLGEYIDHVNKVGVATNVVPLVGFGTVRNVVMGPLERPATPEECAKMRVLVAEAIDEGAFGMSTGLFYAPQCFAPTEEVIEVAKALKPKEALYVTHPRDESDYTIGYGAAIQEGIDIARAAGVAVQISHLHALGVATWKRAPEYVEIMQKARDQGIDVTADQYPYAASAGGITGSVIPRWALDGGREKMLERLADKATRDKIAKEVAIAFKRRGGVERHTIATYLPNPAFEGLTVDKVAEILGEPPEYAVLTMLEKGDSSWVSKIIDEEDIVTFIKAPWVMGGSDGSSLALTGPVSGGKPHPRNFGTFPRWIGTYGRDMGLFRVEEIVRKLTSLPAQRFGLKERGLLKEGFWADVVVFDWHTIKDTATWDRPHQFPEGIDYVFVNGELVVDHKKHTGKLAGKALRKQ
jgi:N-acyl-D-amino-acid deacylase